MVEHADKKFIEEVENLINDYVSFLASMGLEMNEDGDIVEIGTHELVLKVDDDYE